MFRDWESPWKSSELKLLVRTSFLPLSRSETDLWGRNAETFDTAASRYHSAVYSRKRLELLSKLNSTLSPFFLAQLKNLHKTVLKEFRKSIQEGLKGEGYDFAEVVKGTKETAENDFVKGAKEVMLEETDWSYEETLNQLREDVVAIADLLRVEETKKMVLLIEVSAGFWFRYASTQGSLTWLWISQRQIKKEVGETVELSLAAPSADMWDKILGKFKDSLAKAESVYSRKASSTFVKPFMVTLHSLTSETPRLQLHSRRELESSRQSPQESLVVAPSQD